jgi:hypothetical protein
VELALFQNQLGNCNREDMELEKKSEGSVETLVLPLLLLFITWTLEPNLTKDPKVTWLAQNVRRP